MIPSGAAVMLHTPLQPIHVAAVWTCRCCKRVSAAPVAGIYWDGTHWFGLVCPDRHSPEDVDTAIALTRESLQ
jgi:hypothetical protein